MACKRSPVRSRYSPPERKKHCTEMCGAFFVVKNLSEENPPDHNGREGYFCDCILLTSKSYTGSPQIPELPDLLLAKIFNPETQLLATPVAMIWILPKFSKTALELFPRTRTVQAVK